MHNPLYHDLMLTSEILKNVDLMSVVFFAASTCLILHVFLNKRANLYRPAFILAMLFFIFYQIPLVLFSGLMETSLPNYSSFAFTIQLSVLFGIIWTLLTPNLSTPSIDISSNIEKINIELKPSSWIFIISLCTGLVLLYLNYVPFQCTGLYAAIFDPEMTLWAREYSIKLSGSKIAAIAYGMLATVVVPVIFVLVFFQIRKNLSQRNIIKSLILIASAAFLLLLALIPFIKGMLMPTMIITLIVLFYTSRNYFSIFFSMLITMTIFFLSLSAIEVFKERSVKASQFNYDAGFCALNGRVCKESILLINSLYGRSESLGLSDNKRDFIKQQINNACSKKSSTERPLLLDNTLVLENTLVPVQAQNDNESSKDNNKIVFLNRFNEFLGAILNRTFVIPFRVASWHYLYAIEYANPGLSILPFYRHLKEQSMDVQREVYQAYGSRYSRGDRTYTSTAPTGYLFLYSAYLGVAGILIAWACIILFDVSASFLLRKFDGANRYIFLGIICVGCLNMLVSDFITVIFTHGLGGGYLLCFLINWIEKLHLNHRSSKELPSVIDNASMIDPV